MSTPAQRDSRSSARSGLRSDREYAGDGDEVARADAMPPDGEHELVTDGGWGRHGTPVTYPQREE